MRNLIAFIWKHNAFFLFLILETFCAYLIVQHNNYQKAAFVNSANDVAGNLYKGINNVTQYFHLKDENEQLAHENALLHSLSLDSYVKLSANDSLTNPNLVQKYRYINAKVVNNSVTKRNNFLTLDKGRRHGVITESAVVGSSGVVGIVKEVSENFSSVMSLLHKDSRISARIKKNNYYGSLTWPGGDYKEAILSDIPTHVQLAKGDTIETNSFSAIFPEGILIGFIESFEIKPGQNFYDITIRLSTNYKNITHVYVIQNLMKEEQKKLEQKAEND